MAKTKRPTKSPRESASEMVQFVLPGDTNPLGYVLGGRVMHWIDLVGGMVAARHSRRPSVTASMERLDFMNPIPQGHMVILQARIHHAGRSSMEVGVEVYSENPLEGTRTHTSRAILTFVALGADGEPTEVPLVDPESAEEKRVFAQAEERRANRISKNTS